MKLVKTFFVYKCILSLALLYLADMFTNKLKTRLTFFFLQNGSKYKENSQPFEEISPEELNKCLQQLYLSVRKRDGRRFGHYAPKL